MAQTKVDAILHPVRLRILLALAGRHITAQQLTQTLPDVPQATLYRQIRHLMDAGLLAIEETRPVRGGVVEKVYGLAQGNMRLTADDVASFSRDDHLRSFTLFITSVLGEFERYLMQEEINVARDVRYHQAPLMLRDDEFEEMVQELTTVIRAYQDRPPAPAARRRLLASIIMPFAEPGSSNS